MSLLTMIRVGKKAVIRRLPELLTGVGIAGFIGTSVLSAKATLELDKVIQSDEGEFLDQKEIRKIKIKYYAPAVFTGLLSAISIIMANRISAANLAKATAALVASRKMIEDHRETIVDLFEEKGLRKVDQKLNDKHANVFFTSGSQVYETGHGNVLCCEGFLTGTLFHAHPEWIHKCVNDFNKSILSGEDLSYNDFISLLIPNLSDRLPAAGDMFHFNYDCSPILLELVEDCGLLESTGEPYHIFTVSFIPLVNSSLRFGKGTAGGSWSYCLDD